MEIFHVRWFLEKIFHDGKNVKAVKHVEIHNDASKKEDSEFDKITCLVIFLFFPEINDIICRSDPVSN